MTSTVENGIEEGAFVVTAVRSATVDGLCPWATTLEKEK
jgi:hypothetical protein